ncbi:amino acid adenylation domain-containing protein [Paenibacillus psychroresistens]|uniref:Amino acid adenylation domain-containing protein n=1 Tax=Paenibacillus psychroresistens TaxID=1778678 RepID=A0A6B8RL82_9BACL|nr:non-ribosomal peptide synthetase [Paenibacillus psychroresistens]QGQ96128.1 amino acid adenylation domain-containing protein [Paenibacillus psychroresistens]
MTIPAPIHKVFHSLTHAQKRVWFTEQIYPGQALHHLGGAVIIHDKIQLDLLEQAIHALIHRHDALRLKLEVVSGEVQQYVGTYEPQILKKVDFSAALDPQTAYEAWLNEESRIPFVLENKWLFEFILFKLQDNKNGYYVKLHHLISDGWSIQIMTEQLRKCYEQLISGHSIHYEKAPSYIEYIEKERGYLHSSRFEKNKTFWMEKFRGMPEGLLAVSSEDCSAKRKSFLMEQELTERLQKFIFKKGVSLNTFFVALMAVYQQKMTGQNDLVIGNPVLNRSGRREREIFGMFTSTMPLRISLAAANTISDVLITMVKLIKECMFNQKYPYNLLIKDLSNNLIPINGLFQICVNYYNTKLPTEWSGGEIENVEFHSGSQLYALQLVVKEWEDSGRIQLDFDYKISQYNENEIHVMFDRLCYLLDQIIKDPDVLLSQLQLLSGIDRQKLIYDFNQTANEYPKNTTIIELFEAQVKRSPLNTAVIFENEQLTYIQLNEKANQLARYLQSMGFKINDFAVIEATHSMDVIIAILAILKAGGVYIPIDPDYPDERVKFILKDSQASFLLTDNPERCKDFYLGMIILISDNSLYASAAASNIGVYPCSNDLVYIMYTSGSTGKPKGVMVEQRGLINYIWWAGKTYIQDEQDTFALYSSLAFDLTVTSIFTPLLYGIRIIVYHDGGTDNFLHNILRDSRVTIVKLTPAHLSLVKDLDLSIFEASNIRTFIIGGDDLKVTVAREIGKLFPQGVSLFNEYGPTETVVGCMIYKYDMDRDLSGSVPIGVPIDNMQIYILDSNLHLSPIGIAGELYIAGDGVARGYLNQPALNKEKFIQNPFNPGSILYKSGDLARRREGGCVEYLGRSDNQVKIRGYRIELGEIENQILNEEGISEAIVIDRTHELGNKSLYAYLILKENKTLLTEQSIRTKLMNKLPAYMVPSYIIFIERFPLTVNGKINRDKLSNLWTEKQLLLQTLPENEQERILLMVVQEILLDSEIGMNSNLYHLGGDSITAIQIATKIKNKGYSIKVKDILNYPVLKEMAAALVEESKQPLIPQEISAGPIELTPITKWFFSQNLPEPNYYHQTILLKIKHPITQKGLKLVMEKIICHHDSLRINYDPSKDLLFYNNQHLNKPFEMDIIHLTPEPAKVNSTILHYSCLLKASFNITSDLLIKACLFDLGEEAGVRLLLSAHHLVMDAISWRILLEDLDNSLSAWKSGIEHHLPAKTTSLQAWASGLQAYAKQVSIEEAAYWKLLDYSKSDRNQEVYTNKEVYTLHSTQSLIALTMEQANKAYGTDFQDLLLAALVMVIREWSNNEEEIVELEGHGREEISSQMDMTRTIGWFTSIYPVKVGANIIGTSLNHHIKTVKELIRRIPNRGIGFGVLKYLTGLEQKLDYQAPPAFRLNYIGNVGLGMNYNFFDIDTTEDVGPESAPSNPLSCGMELNVLIVNGQLEIRTSYSISLFPGNSAILFLLNFEKRITEIITHCLQKEEVEYTPADFDGADLSQFELDELFS